MKLQSVINFVIIFVFVFAGSYFLELLFPDSILKYVILGFVIWIFLHFIEKIKVFSKKEIPRWLGYSIIAVIIVSTILLF